jgi:AcrR family transcriptional regulator
MPVDNVYADEESRAGAAGRAGEARAGAAGTAADERGSAPAHSPRDRLVGVTLDLIATEGIESLTLRRIARRAGVSHGAPLRHFSSLADLLAEVAAHGFRLLSERIAKTTGELPPGTAAPARLAAAGRAYTHVAVENPGLFALMFRPDRLDAANPRFAEDSGAAFEHLVRHVRAAQQAGWHAAHDTRLLAGVVWSAMHGLASLWSQGALQKPIPEASLEAVLELSLALTLSP